MYNAVNYKYPLLESYDTYPEYGDTKYSLGQKLYNKRHKSLIRKVSAEDRYKALAGSLIGISIPLALMMKKQKVKSPFKLNYGLTDMVTLSGASILGGVSVGSINEDKRTIANKCKEGFFQFMNAAVPAWVVGGVLRLTETSKHFNNVPGKILATVGGLLVGLFGAASLSNIMFDPKDKNPDRKLKMIDCVANIDDAIGVLVLAKFPFVGKFHLERILPFIYTYCGYRAGKSN